MAIVRTSKYPHPVAAGSTPVPAATRSAGAAGIATDLRVRIRRRPDAGLKAEASLSTEPASLPETSSQPIARSEPDTVSAPNPPKRRRGHATRDENGKWQPTGNYRIGFCMPPVHGQFKGKPGPGRPKGTKSQDSLMREMLEAKRKVRVDGRTRSRANRELINEMQLKLAFDKNLKAILSLQAEAKRLYPERDSAETTAVPPMADIRDMDRQLMAMVSGLMGIGEALPALDLVGTPADLPADNAGDTEPWEDEQDWDAPDEPEEPSDGQ